MMQISFVVDGLDRHYFQAELLLLSLERFGEVPRERILVQCTSRVEQVFLDYLANRGYRHRTIAPFLDGRYCNKLRQLEAFLDLEIGGVFLLDADMFVLEPLRPPSADHVCAKVVDLPNPPLAVLQRIFDAAQVPVPKIVGTDVAGDGHATFAGNCNGGYYYVPARWIQRVNDGWTRWGQWLFERPHLFDSTQQATHTDQVAMALALADGEVPYQAVASNTNCPTHLVQELQHLDAKRPVEILHYHWQLSPFGLIDPGPVESAIIRDAVLKANRTIVESSTAIRWFSGYRRSLVRPPADPALAATFAQRMRARMTSIGGRLRLVLHAGTPKTGTTSQQHAMADGVLALRRAGWVYPSNFQRGDGPPKHQWLVSCLLAGDLVALEDRLLEVLAEVEPDCHTIVLSTEGIFNHWYDFPDSGRAAMAALRELFDTTVWVWFRDGLGFMNSYYQQNLKNPQMDAVASYGRDLSMAQMLQDPWVAGHLDYLGFLMECEACFGGDMVRAFGYQEDAVGSMAGALGVALQSGQRPALNVGLSTAAIDMLRIVNRYPLLPAEKQLVVAALGSADVILCKHAGKVVDDPGAHQRIRMMMALQSVTLRRNYGVTTI